MGSGRTAVLEFVDVQDFNLRVSAGKLLVGDFGDLRNDRIFRVGVGGVVDLRSITNYVGAFSPLMNVLAAVLGGVLRLFEAVKPSPISVHVGVIADAAAVFM